MKTKEISGLSDKELKERLSEEKLNLTKLVLSHSVSPLENPMRITNTRKLIAKLNTEIQKRLTASTSKQVNK
jgi:large subunit ribosomal protein L29